MTEEPEYDEEDAPLEVQAGSITALNPVSEKDAKKNLRNRNPVGFRRRVVHSDSDPEEAP